MKIFITTTNSENSFVFKKDNEPEQTLPKIYKLEKVTSQYRQNINDDSVGFTILAENVFNQEKLFKNVKLQDISVNGEYFETFSSLSQTLTPILFKLGGGPGAGGAENIPKLISLTLEDLGMTSENTEEEINQALSNYINRSNLTIGEKELYFFQIVTDTIKKTYLIKDQGKGLVENLTPDKLFDIANGNSGGSNSSGVDNSNDYSVDEIKVGKFIYLNDNGNKVSKPIYRKVFKSTLQAKEHPMKFNMISDGFDIIYLDDQIQNIINASAEFIMFNVKLGFGTTTIYNMVYDPIRYIINTINIGYLLSNSNDEIYIDGFIKITDDVQPNLSTVSLPNDTPYTLYLEYTKMSDSETIV